MSYDTSYSLKWEPLEPQTTERKPTCAHKVPKSARYCPACGAPIGMIDLSARVAEAIRNNEEMRYALCADGRTNNGDARWSEFDKDMKAISASITDVLFTLTGEGEEAGDLWRAYFLNGKMQEAKARIEYDPFDKTKLT